ncbi:mobilization protein [Mucilaginibacter sp. SG564]|uniref:mobilization protein n=1 Tax=Mucilaginibacter sp. SG564 TaxID=2587022 RepID=UPI00155399C8|nr:mobilization protein [Mucilaginibacter sp. SG564]NOW98746.1 ABC-type transport system substrate-binding protein [Mucilaginibacter sp. SG564]
MPRKKLENPEEILSHPIILRVTEKVFLKLEKLMKESGYQSIGEVARMILSDQPIKCFYVDVSMNAPMEQLALIRKELKAVGININQQTRYFHQSRTDAQKGFYALKTAGLYQQVGQKTEELLRIVNALAAKWLQDS